MFTEDVLNKGLEIHNSIINDRDNRGKFLKSKMDKINTYLKENESIPLLYILSYLMEYKIEDTVFELSRYNISIYDSDEECIDDLEDILMLLAMDQNMSYYYFKMDNPNEYLNILFINEEMHIEVKLKEGVVNNI